MAEVIEISRMALTAQVTYRLRQLLIEGRIAPGAKLNERELCEQLNVSRTPLREAIKLLGAEGLVDLLPNRGAVAVKLTETDIANAFEVLGGLEAMSGQLAAERITEDELAEIRATHYEMLASFTRRDLSSYYRLNAVIHSAINAAAKNPVLTSTYNSINARMQSMRFRTNQNETKWKQAMKEHQDMLDALVERDGNALGAILKEHLANKRDTVLELLRKGAIYDNKSV